MVTCDGIRRPVLSRASYLRKRGWDKLIAVGIAIIGLAVASLVTAGVAIVREKERSILLVVIASLTFLLVVTFAVGEAFGATESESA